MSLEYILLGMLRKPSTGYDLRSEFEEGAAYFWAAEFSQIYPALKRMEERGWLKCRTEPSAKGPERRVYTRTPAGAEELIRWLRSEPVMGTERFAYIGQLVFLYEIDDLNVTRKFIESLRDELLKKVQLFREVLKSCEAIPGFPELSDPVDFHSVVALQIGIESIEGRIRGCDASLLLVDRRLQKEVTHV